MSRQSTRNKHAVAVPTRPLRNGGSKPSNRHLPACAWASLLSRAWVVSLGAYLRRFRASPSTKYMVHSWQREVFHFHLDSIVRLTTWRPTIASRGVKCMDGIGAPCNGATLPAIIARVQKGRSTSPAQSLANGWLIRTTSATKQSRLIPSSSDCCVSSPAFVLRPFAALCAAAPYGCRCTSASVVASAYRYVWPEQWCHATGHTARAQTSSVPARLGQSRLVGLYAPQVQRNTPG
mmetsp:Transcript_21193/g.59277  ORF Transcript_21193/g.59277 Transcript_21193/m.59277 type:complete len:235 (-) Transcript_21193:103-807(-)